MTKAPSRPKIIKSDRRKLCRAVLTAAEIAGDQFGDRGLVSYLHAQAIATPSPFLTLLSKVLADDTRMTEPRVTRIEIVTPQVGTVEERQERGEPDG